jgi:hypothetical protein
MATQHRIPDALTTTDLLALAARVKMTGDVGTRDEAHQLAEGVEILEARLADRTATATLPALERLTETVTGRPYQEVSADLDRQVAEHPDDETRVIDDPDAPSRITPDEIADAIRAHREHEHLAQAPFVALADLVIDWIAATKAVEERDRTGSPHNRAMLDRLDACERALAMAVRR